MNNFCLAFKKVLNFLLIICIVAVIAYISFVIITRVVFKDNPSVDSQSEVIVDSDIAEDKQSFPVETEVDPTELHTQDFTVGDFGPDEERLSYESGSMTLIVPKINYSGSVLSVDLNAAFSIGEEKGLSYDETYSYIGEEMNVMLDLGVVLFNQAQLPGAENRNVSIAGHRDAYKMEFLAIDTLSEGDQIYLVYKGNVYIYDYEKTVITNDSDWSLVAVQEKSVISLQSCDPPYSKNGYDRIFVVGVLSSIIKEEDFDLPNSSNAGEEVPPLSLSEVG